MAIRYINITFQHFDRLRQAYFFGENWNLKFTASYFGSQEILKFRSVLMLAQRIRKVSKVHQSILRTNRFLIYSVIWP